VVQEVRQGGALHVLHHRVQQPLLLVLQQLEGVDQVRVVRRRGPPGLGREPALVLRVLAEVRAEGLQDHPLLEARGAGEHGAVEVRRRRLAQRGGDAVPTDTVDARSLLGLQRHAGQYSTGCAKRRTLAGEGGSLPINRDLVG
jgi:hypothetical protein